MLLHERCRFWDDGDVRGGSKDQMIPLADVPNNFLDTAKEKLPEVTFEQALKRGDGSWEIRGKDRKGKTRDVELSATGEEIGRASCRERVYSPV